MVVATLDRPSYRPVNVGLVSVLPDIEGGEMRPYRVYQTSDAL